MRATALGVCACQQGRRVRFTTLAGLATELQEADSRKELARVVGRYTRIEVLVLDELGYLALPDGAAELVFQVISERNERASMICTTNLPFGEWTKVFPDPRLAKAVVDRITHKAHIITPAPSPGASATAWTARKATRHDPPPCGRARGYRRNDPRATRSGHRDGSRGILSAGRSGNIQTNNHRREVGPDQAVTVGPTQVVVLKSGHSCAWGAEQPGAAHDQPPAAVGGLGDLRLALLG
jgi:hypothetical protein